MHTQPNLRVQHVDFFFWDTLLDTTDLVSPVTVAMIFQISQENKVCDKDIKEHRALKLGEQKFIRSNFSPLLQVGIKTKEKNCHFSNIELSRSFCLNSVLFHWYLFFVNMAQLRAQSPDQACSPKLQKNLHELFSKHYPHLMYVKA